MRTVPGATDHVVVVGAGLAGLSAAMQLAGRGRQVTVVERYDLRSICLPRQLDLVERLAAGVLPEPEPDAPSW